MLMSDSWRLATPAAPAPVPVGVELPRELFIADLLLAGAGLTLLALAAARWRRWLAPGPLRSNRLAPEMLLVPLSAYILLQLAAGAMVGAGGDVPADTPRQLLSGTLVKLAGGLVCVLLAHYTFTGGAAGFIAGQRRPGRDVALGLLAFVAVFPLCWGLNLLSEWGIRMWDPQWQPPEHEVLLELQRPDLPPWTPLTLWAGAVLVAPFSEEAFFRGIFQTGLGRIIHPRGAVVLVAAAFGLAHANQPQVILPLFMLGLALGWVYERCGSLIAPMALHLVFNLKTMVYFTISMRAGGVAGP